jgi:hypothetical protein
MFRIIHQVSALLVVLLMSFRLEALIRKNVLAHDFHRICTVACYADKANVRRTLSWCNHSYQQQYVVDPGDLGSS